MTTIAELAHKDTRAGSGRHWHSHTFTEKGNTYREVWHYSTCMLRYSVDPTYPESMPWNQDLDTVYVNTGHGSKSDQGGLNTLFRELGMPLYYSRAGGATIELLVPNNNKLHGRYDREVFQS